MKKKIVMAAGLSSLAIMLITGCAGQGEEKQKQKTESSAVETETLEAETDIVETEKNLDEIKDDLNANAAKFLDVVGDGYQVTDLELIKRNTKGDSDAVYCTVSLENGTNLLKQDFKFSYNHYTTGGWILDEFEATGEAVMEGGEESGDYANLQEFIDLICSYSDPPDLEGKELEDYFKGEYDLWKSKKAYTNIVEDDSGKLRLEDHSSEYVGRWGDSRSQRCMMDIECTDGVTYSIDINWSSGAAENTHWIFTGTYDSNHNGIAYYGSCVDEGIQNNTRYTDGEGLIYLGNDGMLYWDDYKESVGAECVFEKF